MGKKKENIKEIAPENIIEKDVDFILRDRFTRYAKYIIQERAIPDIRDGLKPVQRRVLYAMHVDKNIATNPYRKSAKTVGNVIANYHPHGDTSVYDALVRMSQPWKLNHTLVDMQGNNGSIDDDPAAAMRYTEARLSSVSNLLLKDIDKESVIMSLNFDDTTYEPVVLPARFPNLLLNGSTGIAIGYATNIPPHNLQELIEGVIYRIANPKSSLDDLLDIIKGPDFPTGGTVYGDLRPIYAGGNGKCVIRAKTEIVTSRTENKLVITEIPYEVVKSALVSKMSDACINIDTVTEIRDESGRENGLRIVIELKQDANAEAVLNYLYKNTPLQINYNYNMVAIEKRRPKLFNLLDALDAFINHQIDIYTKIFEFDLSNAIKRLEIIKGLIKATSILDEIIAIIRSSDNKADSKSNLEKRFGFTPRQSEAIVMLQLYRLSRTDVVELEKEAAGLAKNIENWQTLLNDRKKLLKVISKELQSANEPYFTKRKSTIINENAVLTIKHTDLISKEEVIIAITKDGYVKRTNLKSFGQSSGLPQIKSGDILIGYRKAQTLDSLLVFFESGTYACLPIHLIGEVKWKDEGKHLSTYVSIQGQDRIVSAFVCSEAKDDITICMVTRNGYIKRTLLAEFETKRLSKPSRCIALTSDDVMIAADFLDGDSYVMPATDRGFICRYSELDVPITGRGAAGVKAISDPIRYGKIVSVIFDKHLENKEIYLFTKEGGAKNIIGDLVPTTKRLNAMIPIYRTFKSDPHQLVSAIIPGSERKVIVLTSYQKVMELTLDGQKNLPFDRILKSSITLDNGEKIVDVTNLRLDIIDSDVQVYFRQPIIKKTLKVEEAEEKEENPTIYDYID